MAEEITATPEQTAAPAGIQAAPETVETPNPAPAAEAASAEAAAPEAAESPMPTDLLAETAAEAEDASQEPAPEPETAPESYAAFKDAEGREFAPESVQGFTDAVRELGLSQEKADKLFAQIAPTARKWMQADLAKSAKAWAEQSRADKEFGGDGFQKNLALAGKAYKEFATPELHAILTASGLGNNPEIIRMFYRVGKVMQQDRGVAGNASAPAPRHPRYPNSNMVVD